MSDQSALFDTDDRRPWQRSEALAESRQARDEAIVRVDANAAPDWKAEARRVALDLARARLEFTTDDVWERLEDTDATTHEPRALGAVMQRLARDGLIVNTHRVQQSRLKKRHARPVAVWRSMIVGQAS